jgi:hypothetical protein
MGNHLFSPGDIGGPGGQTDDIGADEGHAQAHDYEERLEGNMLLQRLNGHALKYTKIWE